MRIFRGKNKERARSLSKGDLLAMCLASLPTMAFAQAPASEPPRESGVAASLMEDIVVTATRQGRAEMLQRVPVTVSAFSGSQLEALKVTTIQTISSSMPGVFLEAGSAYVGAANFAIRGLAPGSSSASVAPTVGTFLDGMYLGVNQGVLLDLFDVEAVEVLRGPQGILFGRNVVGGAVLLRSVRPTQDFDLKMRVRAESGPEYSGAVAVGGGLAEGISARVAMLYRHDLGYFNNVTLKDKHFGEIESFVVKPTLRLQPDDRTDMNFFFEFGKLTGDGPVTYDWVHHGKRYDEVYIDFRGESDLKWQSGVFELTRDVGFGDGRLTNILGARRIKHLSPFDADGSELSIVPVGSFQKQKQISEELRYNGTFGRVRATLGLYYFFQDLTQFNSPLNNFATQGGRLKENVYAVFGQLDGDVSDNLTLTVGGRFTHERKSAALSRLGREDGRPQAGTFDPGLCNFAQRRCTYRFRLSDSWDSFLPKVGLQFRPTDKVQLYATAQKAYRSGGFNVRYNSAPEPTAYQPEKQNSFEVGFKSDLFDRRTRLNGAAYYTKAKGLQRDVSQFDAATGSSISRTFNAGTAVLKGFEFELAQRLAPHLVLNANVGYVHARYKKVTADLNRDGVVNDIDRRQRLKAAAPWSYTIALTADHDFDFGTITGRASYSYRSNSYGDATNFMRPDGADLSLFPVKMINVNIGFTPAGSKMDFSIYGRNLLNTFTLATNVPIGTAANGSALNKGRVLGAELSFKY